MKDLKQIAAMLAETGYKEEAEAVLQAEKDAARYRLSSEQDTFCDFVIHAFGLYCHDKDGADRVIDTAIQSHKD